jgi:aminoglycoside phosphotransferase (APT) family kinase protein
VHELDVPDVGRWRAADWLVAARSAALQVAALVPSVVPRLEAVCARLAATVPDDGAGTRDGDGGEIAFCQGDFVPGQILCAGPPAVPVERWSVLDLDDGHRADPHSEVASLYTALERELPVDPGLVQHARETYLESYTAAAGRPLDPARWRWFRAVAELRYLARRSVKGRARPGEADVVLDALDDARSGTGLGEI